MELWTSIEIENTDNLNHIKTDSLISKFPPEIWLQIAQYGIDLSVLMVQNRLLLETFAPIVYEEVHGILVLSDLEKTRNSDQCFLRNGPDIPGSRLDNYGIYVRSKLSHGFDYEVLDIKFRDNNDTIHRPAVQCSMKGPTIVTANYSKLKIFMTEIILNPESIMKKYLHKFSIDFAIFSNLDKFVEDFEESLGHSIDQLHGCEVTRYEERTKRLPVYSSYDEFSQKRVRMRPNMLKDLTTEWWELTSRLLSHFLLPDSLSFYY